MMSRKELLSVSVNPDDESVGEFDKKRNLVSRINCTLHFSFRVRRSIKLQRKKSELFFDKT